MEINMRPMILLFLLLVFTIEPASTTSDLSEAAVPLEPGTAAENHQEKRLNAAYDKLIAAGFTGLVSISVKGRIVYLRAHDSNDRAFGLDTPIDILSMTKSLTGAAIGRLMVDGKLKPESRISEFFSDVPKQKSGITVHQLLTHTSGFPQALGEDHEYLDRNAYLTRAWSIPLVANPGSRYEYSNVGYSVLAAIIEQITGQSYDSYLRENITSPAGMTSTGYNLACCTTDGTSVITDTSWGGPKPSWHLIGNGGLLSTPRDMMRWIISTQSQHVQWIAIRELTQQPYQREGENARSHYGYGLVVEEHPQFGRAYWHNGGSRSYNGHWRYYEEHSVGIFVTSDQWDVDPDTVERELAQALFQEAR